MIIVVYGSSGSGKTQYAERIKDKYKCLRIVDEWQIGDQTQLRDGDLVLTQIQDGWANSVKLISIEEALK